MLKSMTGYGKGEYKEEKRELKIEIKTVNHRYSDISIRMPRHLNFIEDFIRTQIAHKISRGRIEVFVEYTDNSEDGKEVILDLNLAKAYVEKMMLLKEEFGLKDEISISGLLRIPDIVTTEKKVKMDEHIKLIFKTAMDNAIKDLLDMREKEGEKLCKDINQKLSGIKNIINIIEQNSLCVVNRYREKLSIRLNELLTNIPIDEQRIAMELAVYADKCSIDEELVRLNSHLSHMGNTLGLKEPMGRKLDFILQEINREINTIASKSADTEIGKLVIELKTETEKIREQVQNIE